MGCEQLNPHKEKWHSFFSCSHPKEESRAGGWGDDTLWGIIKQRGESEPHLATPTDLSELPALVTSSEAHKQETAGLTSSDSQTPNRGTCPQEVMK